VRLALLVLAWACSITSSPGCVTFSWISGSDWSAPAARQSAWTAMIAAVAVLVIGLGVTL
jgi:hypothetical protein